MKDKILFHIYAGLSGGFGGASFQTAEYFENEDLAMEYARNLAVMEYESYSGDNNPPDWCDIAEDNELDQIEDEDEISDLYDEEVESWIDFFVVRADEDGEVDGYMCTGDAIDEFDGEYAFLSNFFPCRFEFDGKIWNSSEAAFQAAKTIIPAEKEEIHLASTPGKVKRLGRKCTMRSDWDDIKIGVMKEVVHAKFAQNPDLKDKLLATDNKILIEGNSWHDNFWGICFHCCPRNEEGVKHNVLGAILHMVRDEFREEQENGNMCRD